MGKKKKKKKKPQKGLQTQLHNLTYAQLIGRGKQSLDAGKPRDAISIFKFAGKKHGQSDEISTFLFRSYLVREAQLREKNLIAEADAVKKQVQEYMPWVDQLTEDDMIAYISTCSSKEAVNIYAGYLSANDISARAEQFLANRFFKSGSWELLDKLDESIPIRRDAEPMQKAIPLMNTGRWDDACDALLPIARSSPFAPVRIFCRAMASFYNENDKDMAKALSMIPDDFPLIGVVRNLEKTVGNGNAKSRNPEIPKLQCLWDGPVNIEADIRDLLYDLEHKRLHQAENSISGLADAIYPEDPVAVRTFMLETIWNMTHNYKIEEYEYRNMAADILPPVQAELLLTKIRFLRFQTPFTTAGQYISLLKNEFPGPETRKIAHAFILLNTVETINRTRYSTAKDKRGIQKYKKVLGIKSETPEMIPVDMVTEAIRLDPLNRAGYEILVDLPRASRTAKNKVEASLTAMHRHFSDDPWPCLELASVFYEKNAFRKAENILEDAMKRAPHDNRVIDRHALALLISAEKNIHRRKFHLVVRDIEKAEKLESRKIAPFIIEKRIICQMANDTPTPAPELLSGKKSGGRTLSGEQNESGQLSLFKTRKDLKAIIGDELAPLALFDQLSILAILIMDIHRRTIDRKKQAVKEVEKLFEKGLKRIKELSSSELVRLLMPLNKDFTSLLPSRKIAPIFFRKQKDILKGVDDSEIIPLYDLIFEPDSFKLIEKDIRRRMKKAAEKDSLLMEFYLVTILHLKREIREPDLFYDIIEDASGPLTEELRAASRRLSKHASGTLKKALETFDFDILDEMDFFGGFPGDIFDDDDLFDDDMEDIFPGEKAEAGIQKLIEQLRALESDPDMADPSTDQSEFIDELVGGFESFVESLSLRNAPNYVINELREILRSDPRMRRDFDMMAEVIDHAGRADQLSREARIILFGNRRKTVKKKKKKK